jgi:CubicO group peptidase (beta-lactamase class C family)
MPSTRSFQKLLWTVVFAAGNAGWPFQFRYRGGRHQPRVPELWTLGRSSAMSTIISIATAFVLLSTVALSPAVAGESASLDQILERIRAKNKLPALAAAVVKDGRMVACGAVGFRKVGSPVRVTVMDKWHIGSCTKSMTAAIAGLMVEQEGWRWDMKVTEMFPDLAREIRPEWQSATLEQFLSQYSGAGSINDETIDTRLLTNARKSPLEQRKLFTRDILIGHAPTVSPGTEWKYDNANYVLVGHAIELKLKQPWETIIRERLFKPLGMESAGFGPPANGKAIEQPWGHILDEAGKLKPIPPDLTGELAVWDPELAQQIRADNPAALGPAGRVHCSIGDLAKYVAWQLRGARGKGTLLKAATFTKLQTRYKKEGEYACGWMVEYRDWAGGDAIFHGGSNGTFTTAIWLAPKMDFAVVVCANLGGTRCETVVDETAGALIKEYLVND